MCLPLDRPEIVPVNEKHVVADENQEVEIG